MTATTHSFDIDDRHEPVDRAPRTALPLVSVVVVNYNYGRYLDDAVQSVFAQSYPNIECIVVDNASTDHSPEIITRLEACHADLKVIRRAANDGQTPASLDGFAASRGQYVIFLDADDYLLPRCIETHIYVHLSMRPHVGFTSGDMLQVAERHVVVAMGEESNRFIRSGKGRNPDLVRPYEAHENWPCPALRKGIEDKIHYVPPLTIRWVWSPTSGLCYRRDALLLFADNAKLATLRTGTDLYFAFGCGGLSGSVVIDEPVFAYRIHGGNIFTAHAQLDRTLNYTPGGHGDSNALAQLYLIDHLVARAKRFTPNVALKANLVALLYRLDLRDVDSSLPKWARRSRVAQAMVRHWDEIGTVLGPAARWTLFVFTRSLRSANSLAQDLARHDASRPSSPT